MVNISFYYLNPLEENVLYTRDGQKFWSKKYSGGSDWRSLSAPDISTIKRERVLRSVDTSAYDTSFHLLKLYADRSVENKKFLNF